MSKESLKCLPTLKESDNKAVILSKANHLKVGVWPLDTKIGPKGRNHLKLKLYIYYVFQSIYRSFIGIQEVLNRNVFYLFLTDLIQSNGICGTDLHLWKNGSVAGFQVKEPMVLGHEPSALVIEVGSKVNHIKVGDRVAVEPIIPCGSCDYCREGRYNMCPSRGLPPMNGCLRKYYTHPAICCFP